MVHSTDEIEQGWLIAPAKWLDLVQVSDRAYTVLRNEVMLNVNAIIRLEDGSAVGHGRVCTPLARAGARTN